MKKTILILSLVSTILNPIHVFANNGNMKSRNQTLAQKTINKKMENLNVLSIELKKAKTELLNLEQQAEIAYKKGNNKLADTIIKGSKVVAGSSFVLVASTLYNDGPLFDEVDASNNKKRKIAAFATGVAFVAVYLSSTYLKEEEYKEILEFIDAKEEEIEHLQGSIDKELAYLGSIYKQ